MEEAREEVPIEHVYELQPPSSEVFSFIAYLDAMLKAIYGGFRD